MRYNQFIRNKHWLGKRASLKSLKRYCLEIWAELVKTRDNHQCVFCKDTNCIQAHHIITRLNLPTRFDVNCGVTLCATHHDFGIESAHVSPWFFYDWLEKNRPEQYAWFLTNREGIKIPKEMKMDEQFYREKLKILFDEFEKVAPQVIKKCRYSRFTSEEEAQICKDYCFGLSRRDLTLKWGTSEQAIETLLKRNSVIMRKPGTRTKEFFDAKKVYLYDSAV